MDDCFFSVFQKRQDSRQFKMERQLHVQIPKKSASDNPVPPRSQIKDGI